MSANLVLSYIFQLLFLIFMQVVIFQKIYLSVYCVPFFYVMFLITLPVHTNKYLVLILGFLLGGLMDVYYYTGGIHAASTTLISYLRFYWLKIIEPSDRYEESQLPVVAMTNRDWFLKYITPIVFLHHFTLFTLEAFSARYLFEIILRTICSSIVSVALIYFFHLIFFRVKNR